MTESGIVIFSRVEFGTTPNIISVPSFTSYSSRTLGNPNNLFLSGLYLTLWLSHNGSTSESS